MAPAPVAPAVIGFDLDMTLVDSADAIIDAITHVCAGHGVAPDPDEIRQTIGLPLDQVFPRWLPGHPYPALLAAYRAYYSEHGVPVTRPMPGAVETVAGLRADGFAVLVVTAKHGPVAVNALAAAGIVVDAVVGDLFGEAKGPALREHDAGVFVGDHVGDIRAAHAAGARAVGVATGPTPAADLRRAGADVVLDDLSGLRAWLEIRG